MSKRSPNTYTKIHTIFRRSERGIIQPEEPLSVPEFEYLRKCLWHCEEKIDGTNIRIEIYLADVGDGLMRRCVRFHGKTDNAQMPPQLLAYLQQEYTATNILAALGWQEYEQIMPDSIGKVEATIYGEGYGKGIQKGAGYSESQKFVAFDVKVGETFLDIKDRGSICEHAGIPVVPCFGQMTIDEAILCVANGFDSRMPGATCPAEGFVLRPLVRLKDARGSRIITKIKHVDFERFHKNG